MENSEDARRDEAVQFARAVAAEFDAVFLLHCPDAETQRIVMPEQPDQGLQSRLDVAIASELVANGVAVAVQMVDRACYLAWLGGRESTRPWRIGYRDPARLLRGPAALDVIGVPASPVRPRPSPSAPRARRGTPADRLIRCWFDDDPAFGRLLGALLDEGRQGILDMAIRKVAESFADEVIEDFVMTLLEEAEATDCDDGSRAALFAVAAFMDPASLELPDPIPAADGLKASGHFDSGCDVSVLPAWFDADAISSLTACSLRRTLRSLTSGGMPAGLQPLDGVPAHGTVAILGVTVNRYPVAWEEAVEIVENRDTPSDAGADPVMAMRDAAFNRWCDVLLGSNAGLLDILFPTAPSQLAGHIDGDDEQVPTAHRAEEVRDFVGIAAREAGDESLVCVPRIVKGEVALSLYTASGHLLDTRSFGEPEGGAVPQMLLAALAKLVTVADDPPRQG